MTLAGDDTLGALESVDGLDRTGILSFDDALKRAGTYDHLPDATTVQVVLGSADAGALHWGEGTNLYYVIDWSGVCIPISVTGPTADSSGDATCTRGTWGTVIDAHTGAFVVSGS